MSKQTLKELRELQGKSRAEVAAALGVTVQSIYRYEQGTRQLSLGQVLKLAQMWGLSAEEIIIAQLNSCQCDQ